MAQVDYSGVKRDVSLMLLPEARVGDYVLVHAGFAMQIVEEQDAAETEALLAEMAGAPRTVEGLGAPRPDGASSSGRGAKTAMVGAAAVEPRAEVEGVGSFG